ncbi:MAG: LamG domain-containing protein [Bacteroidales bacterium]|nr:LamG domain-containing protein [Bacteroidales bacterium]
MENNNVILNMPFDESDGALIAYDYSANRNDGSVVGANFVPGRNGNAIKFKGNDKCTIDNMVISDFSDAWSILVWVRPLEIECGTPKKLIWMLNFGNTTLNHYRTVEIPATTAAWSSVGITHHNGVYHFYYNGSLYDTIETSDALAGLSLNQDCYCEYGLALMDDFKIYNIALTESEIISELSTNVQQAYYIDGVNIKEAYGICVSGSDGVLDRPKLKAPLSIDWSNYHGEVVDLEHKYYEPREITLSCFVKANTKMDFINKVAQFTKLFDKNGTQRLMISVHPTKPLIYEVYCKDAIAISKTWSNDLMVGTFKLKLTEPEPVKRILKHFKTGADSATVQVLLKTVKCVNIYWGDGTVDKDIYSEEGAGFTHTYTNDGEYFIVITGCINEIAEFSTNAIVIWNEL